ncbi:MAG TPA: hypothetical protein VJ826_15505 [Candidatus Polarisedimenticolaceae bacterium]|nr:hypothetical protein [Candidatus Polarisedimenticolaceae bacterium]
MPRRIVISIAIVALWAALWGAVVAMLSAVALVVDPKVVGPGEGPADVVWIGAHDGAITGAVFALLLALGERNRNVAHVPYLRAVMWGVFAAAILRVTEITDVNFSNSAVVGSLSALATMRLARALTSRAFRSLSPPSPRTSPSSSHLR